MREPHMRLRLCTTRPYQALHALLDMPDDATSFSGTQERGSEHAGSSVAGSVNEIFLTLKCVSVSPLR